MHRRSLGAHYALLRDEDDFFILHHLCKSRNPELAERANSSHVAGMDGYPSGFMRGSKVVETWMRNLVVMFSLLLVPMISAGEEKNLLPNGSFAGTEPLKGWLTDFPDEEFYKGNAPYIKMAPSGEAGGRKAVVFDLPAGIAGNQGGKIESVPVPVVAGATYRVEVDCMTWDFSAKIHAEAWSTDPNPDQKRTIFRRAPADGRPALIMCYRAQVPSPPGKSKTWTTAGREFKVPEKVVVAGKDQKPEYVSVKVVAYEATQNAGRSYFSNFRLIRVEPKTGEQKDPSKP